LRSPGADCLDLEFACLASGVVRRLGQKEMEFALQRTMMGPRPILQPLKSRFRDPPKEYRFHKISKWYRDEISINEPGASIKKAHENIRIQTIHHPRKSLVSLHGGQFH